MTRREASRRCGVEGDGERRQQHEDEAPGAVLNAATPPASSPEQWPTVERRAPTLLACAGTELPRIFADDVLTVCACGASIYHRPGALHELGPGARAACLPCAARYDAQQASLDASAPQRLSPRTAGITRRALVEAAHYLGEYRR